MQIETQQATVSGTSTATYKLTELYSGKKTTLAISRAFKMASERPVGRTELVLVFLLFKLGKLVFLFNYTDFR